MPQTALDALQSQSIYILREAFNRFDRLALLLTAATSSAAAPSPSSPIPTSARRS